MSATPDQDALLGILQAVTDAVYTVDGAGRLGWCNRRAEEVFARPRDELAGQPVTRLLQELGAPAAARAHETALRTGTADRAEEFLAPLGVWAEAHLFPADAGLTVFVREITARKRAELDAHLRTGIYAAVEQATGPLDGLARLTAAVRELTGIEVGEVWLRDDPAARLRLARSNHAGGPALERFARAGEALVPDDQGPLVRALAEGDPVVADPTAVGSDDERSAAATTAGLRASLLLPTDLGSGAGAVLALHATAGPGHDDWFTLLQGLERVVRGVGGRLRLRQDLDRVFRLSGQLLAVTNDLGHIVRVNPALAHALGDAPDDLVGRDFTDFVHRDDLAATRALQRQLAAGEHAGAFEHRVVSTAGHERILSWVSEAVPSEGLFYSAARDVTEERAQQRFEAAQRDLLGRIALGEPLSDLLAQLCRAVEARHPGSCATVSLVADGQGRLEVAAAPSLPAELADALDGAPVAPVSSPCGVAAHDGEPVVVADLADPAVRGRERHAARAHGIAAGWAVPFGHTDDGGPLGVLTAYRRAPGAPDEDALEVLQGAARLADIAVTRAHTEEALRASHERFRRVARATADAVWDYDVVTDELWWGEGYHTLFGHDPDAADSSLASWSDHVHPEDRDTVVKGLQTALDEGEERWSAEYRYLRADGSVAHVLDRAQIVHDEQGRPLRAIGGMTDLTEHRELQARYLRAQRLESIGTLAGGVAHDLNNVLTPILIAADMLAAADLDERERELLEMVSRGARRGADMVSQVLTFARGADGERALLEAHELVDDVVRMAQDSFPKDVTVTATVDDDVHRLVGDLTQLQQVLLNLAVNGRDAMPQGGTLRVHTQSVDVDEAYASMHPKARPGRYVRVTVADTGTGMTREDHERIFEPFFTTKDVGEGTGLGLATSLAIVESHAGFIDVDSEPGRGSAFAVYLPAAPSDAAAAARSDEEIVDGDGQLVLVAEDEPAVRTAAQQTLEAHGYRVVSAADGADAVAVFARHVDEVAVVIMDMSMPVLDGIAAIHAIRRLDAAVPVVVSSGLQDEARALRAAEAGAGHVLPKPYATAALLRTVGEALQS